MRRILALVATSLIAASFVVLVGSAPASAARSVTPDRWTRTVCSAWTGFTDEVETAYRRFDGIATSVEDGSLSPERARRVAIASQTGVVDASNRVVRAIERTAPPKVDNGPSIRSDYLATVKEFRRTDLDFLAAIRRLPVDSTTGFIDRLKVAGAERTEAWDVIGINPLEELREDPTLTAAMDGEGACQAVDDWFDLGYLSEVEIGDCWDANQITIACSRPHRSELYLQIEHPAARGVPYPGDAVDEYARQQCEAAFAGYVGRDYESSSLDFVYFFPDQQTWKANDREILCVVENIDGSPRTGSVRNTGL